MAYTRQQVEKVLRPIYRCLPYSTKALCRNWWAGSPAQRIQQVSGEPRCNWGAVNEGQTGWAKRWAERDQSRRVLVVAPKDFAGSAFKWAEALNIHTDLAVRLISFEKHQFGYPVDLVVPECDAGRRKGVLELASQAGVLHLKDEHSWFFGGNACINKTLLQALFFGNEFASTPKIFTHYGGYARKFKDNADYISAVTRFQGRVAMTPDLNYEWFEGAFIPHAIDTDTMPFAWTDSRIFAHSPSSPEKKATDLFEGAVETLAREHGADWAGWSTDLIHGVPFSECLQRKQQASLFFDQAGRHSKLELGIDDIIGWYGNSAIEAMVCGIPTIAHLSEHALSRAAAAGVDLSDCPVMNIERTRNSMVETVLAFCRASPKERLELAQRTRDYTVRLHGYKACAQQLAQLYANLTTPTNPQMVERFS